MKTSYKIITTLIVILFTALLTTNISLKAKYIKGDFNIMKSSEDDIFTQGDLTKKKLGNFKHMVIDGVIATKNGRQVKFNPIFSINSGKDTENVLGIKKNYSSLLKTHIKNDTLYISFQKNYINEDNLKQNYLNQIIVFVRDLHSVNAKNSQCTIESILSGKPFNVIAENAYININYIKTDLLTLNIRKNSNVNINGYGTINKITTIPPRVDNLNYTLGHGSSISIANKELIGKINCLTPTKNIVESYNKSLYIVNNSK